MKCSECDAEDYLVVDGRHMSDEELNKMPYPPRSIKRYMNHTLWCTKREKD
jgi:transcriptional regulator NrdR family protein